MNKITLFFLIFCIIGPSNKAYNQEQVNLGEVIEKYVKAEAEYDLFSGTVLVSMNGNTIYQGAFGYANKEQKILRNE